jgi:hypothetical protein
MLSNIDLDKMATTNGISLVGIFSKDELPSRPRNGNYIINLQDADDGNGTHWTAFTIIGNKYACYFDSFGFMPPTPILNYLSSYKPYGYSNRQIQDISSDYCGYYCLAFLKTMKTSTKQPYERFDDFLNKFTNDLKKNDKLVVELLNKK